jgi:uncharacterized protein YpuA (DUF1002 family)
MIEIEKQYKITFTETQVKELYEVLRGAKDIGYLGVENDLKLVYNELKKIFDSGIR